MLKLAHSRELEFVGYHAETGTFERELEFVGYHAEAGEFIGTILGKRKYASISDFLMLSFH